MERRRNKPGISATSIRSYVITLLISTQSSYWWMRWKNLNQMQVLTWSKNQKRGDKLLMQNLVPLFLPPRYISMKLMSKRKESASFTNICGWWVLHCTSLLIAISRRTSSEWILSSIFPYRQHCTHNHTTLDESTKEVIFVSTNNVVYPTTTSPSNIRYCVMFLPLKFVILFWDKIIYGNVILYMNLGLTVLLLLWTWNCTRYLR